MLQRKPKWCSAVWAVVSSITAMIGCESSSHTSMRMYDYSDEPRSARIVRHQPTADESEAEIEELGEMVSPGEMVPPGRMVPPGALGEDDLEDEGEDERDDEP